LKYKTASGRSDCDLRVLHSIWQQFPIGVLLHARVALTQRLQSPLAYANCGVYLRNGRKTCKRGGEPASLRPKRPISKLNSSGLMFKTVCVTTKSGDAGYRSPYFSHAKRALYHLSYIPNTAVAHSEPGSSGNRTRDLSHPKRESYD
jgi:hypothetical protein